MTTTLRSALPTYVAPTLGARITLPASSTDEAVRGSGRQVRILRAPSLGELRELVTREIRAFAMTFVGETRAQRKRGEFAGKTAYMAIAAGVLAKLDAGDFVGAVTAHVEGFGLGVVLPPQLGGAIGECFELPAPVDKRKLVLDEEAAVEEEVAERTEELTLVTAESPLPPAPAPDRPVRHAA
ncbi:hypothetical protein J421_4699 (plasmid) [Gemmatirosa kalamazoonensis]|uniref:Uncharacterized protein n=1 Tax=Gemmatirosa kalamazoonensis TaxID=861299 RepID=W0RMH0_9BACT|nr:hypothetical protein [Gemmatirosa kalamazoonensis]AHG92234.1 hypothetical protein J421_4699 [Gemmatirosa kalamazoonensis]